MNVKKFFSLLAATSFLIAGNSNFVHADTIININNSNPSSINKNQPLNNGSVYNVTSEYNLEIAVDNVKFNDTIVLLNDITLTRKLKLTRSVNINLNGHNIFMKNNNAQIEVGYEKFDRSEPYNVYHPGYYITEETRNYDRNSNRTGTSYKRVWHPGYNEVKYKKVYKYGDNIHVTFSNGTINGAKGQDGRDGIANSSHNYHGVNGENGNIALIFISGKIHFINMKVNGGNGGNGGNGSYQSLWHIPLFGGGRGGNGGNGGKGASAIYITRNECTYTCDNSRLYAGLGGKGGKGGQPNQNYWVYSAKKGKNGIDG